MQNKSAHRKIKLSFSLEALVFKKYYYCIQPYIDLDSQILFVLIFRYTDTVFIRMSTY